VNEKKHDPSHALDAIELPVAGGGYSVHETYCASCSVEPIVGPLFVCVTCSIALCRKCFWEQREPGDHKSSHDFEVLKEAIKHTHHARWYNSLVGSSLMVLVMHAASRSSEYGTSVKHVTTLICVRHVMHWGQLYQLIRHIALSIHSTKFRNINVTINNTHFTNMIPLGPSNDPPSIDQNFRLIGKSDHFHMY